MNYYDHNIGDFAAMTQGLDFEGVGICIRLLDRFMLTEKPIKTQWVSLAFPKELHEKVFLVLSGLFEEVEDGWVYEPFVEVLERYAANRLKNQENGKKGGRPRKTQQNPMGSSGFSTETQTEPIQKATNNQEPITNIEVLPDGSTCGNSCADAPELPPEQEAEPQLIEKPLKQQNCPTKEIVDSYNEILGPWLGRVREVTPSRRTAIRARWLDVIRVCGVSDRETSIVATRAYFEKIARSNFLMGRVEGAGRKWKADFDWILKSDSFTKIYEGKYDNQR